MDITTRSVQPHSTHIIKTQRLQKFLGPRAQGYSQDSSSLGVIYSMWDPIFPQSFSLWTVAATPTPAHWKRRPTLWCPDWPWSALIRSCPHLWNSHCCQGNSGCWLIHLDNIFAVELRQSCSGKLALKIFFFKKDLFVAFAKFFSIHSPTMADFRMPDWPSSWMFNSQLRRASSSSSTTRSMSWS